MQSVQILRAVLAALGIALAFAVPVAADAPKGGLLVITEDHLTPGSAFTVLGSRIDPGATVTFRLEGDIGTVELGDAHVAQDGTLSASFDLPADVPHGDAYLRGRTSTGVDLELYVHVGPRSTAPGVQRPTDGPIDERVIGLLMAGFGFVVLVVAAAWYVRTRPRPAD